MEPGNSKAKHLNPMQALLAAAAVDVAASLLRKLQSFHLTIDNLELETSAERTTSLDANGNSRDVYTSIKFHFHITSPDANEKEIQALCTTHSCSVLDHLKVGDVSITAEVKELVEI